MYIIYYIKNNYMFRHFSLAIFFFSVKDILRMKNNALSNTVNTDGSIATAKINTCFAVRIMKWLIKVNMQQHGNITAAHHTGGVCLVMSHAFPLQITHRYHDKAVSVHAMIVDGDVKGQVHVFLTLAQDRGVVSFIPWLLYPQAKQPRHPLNRRMVGPHRGSAWIGEEKNLLLPPWGQGESARPYRGHRVTERGHW